MNESKIRKLLEIFRESGLDEMEYRESFWRGMTLRLGRRSEAAAVTFTSPPVAPTPAPAVPADSSPTEPDKAAAAVEGLHAISSPMVGTFYRAPSPDSDPFAEKGDVVKAGQTVCIVEAMKIMNEIESDVDGEIVEVAAPDGEPVEYGQPLFRIRPA